MNIGSAVTAHGLGTSVWKLHNAGHSKTIRILHQSIRLFTHNFSNSAKNIKSAGMHIFDSVNMTDNTDAAKKEKILSMLSTKDSLNSSQLASMLGTGVDDVKRLLLDLQAMKLIENVVGDYYHLTYEGYRYLKNMASSKRLW